MNKECKSCEIRNDVLVNGMPDRKKKFFLSGIFYALRRWNRMLKRRVSE